MNKELPLNYTISVEPLIYDQVKSAPPGNYEIDIPMCLGSEYVFRGIDGDSFVMFNESTGHIRKLTPPFGRNPEVINIQSKALLGDSEPVFMKVRSVSPRLIGQKWNWHIQLSP